MGGIGFIILIIVIVSIYRTMTKAAKEANEKAIKQTTAQPEEVIEDTPVAIPKSSAQQSKYTAIKTSVKQQMQEEPRPEIKLDSMEEVRRAIIYSEIINRKY